MYKNELNQCEENSELMAEFTDEDVEQTLKNVRNGKAAGADGILPVFLKTSAPKEGHGLQNWQPK